MKTDIVMPQMGESIAEGTIVKWRKKIGDRVEKDEIILEISTDKVDSEIPSPIAGVMAEIVAAEGETVEVGKTIARINTGETDSARLSPPAQPVDSTSTSGESVTIPVSEERSRIFLSPLVKKIAHEHGIEISEVKKLSGTGLNGRITKDDLLAYIHSRGSATLSAPGSAKEERPTIRPTMNMSTLPATTSARAVHLTTAAGDEDDDVEFVEMDHVRKRIAEHMVMSKQTAPHVTSVAEADVSGVVEYREKMKSEFETREGVKLTFTAFFVQAAARALREFPLINSSVDKSRIVKKKRIHIGVAVGLENGLIVPVIRNADQLNLIGIARSLQDLTLRARNKRLQPQEVQGGTFSITNIGTFGNLFGTPIINQPQVAILGIGAIKKRPVVVNDMIAIRSMMYISLTYDHRLIDGLYGGSFLQRMVQLCENFEPEGIY
ncbi:2-oxo acid dehydrogenase subunit E2 [candidate division KSB1 bacterium]|nr:2-oxo acid dehydrogenase subunit E2 [candidate division KSB1 bacterium]